MANKTIHAGVQLFNRNPWTNERLHFHARTPGRPRYESDGLCTDHAQPFLDDADFQRAYQRASTAIGFDAGLEWRLHTMLWAASSCQQLSGCFVECGTGRGFMTSGICEYLGWTDRPFYLLDTFESSLPEQPRPQVGVGCPFYADGPDQIVENFAEWPGVQLIVGRIPESLMEVPEKPVAFLHIDMNDPEPEAAAVRHFWPRLCEGAIVVFDDYGLPGFDRSRESADRLATELGFLILTLPTGQGLVINQPG